MPSSGRYFVFDTNIMNHLVTGADGRVVETLNESLSSSNLIKGPETAYCMTPFQVLEALGTKLPVLDIELDHRTGDTAPALFDRLREDSLQAYLALPELGQSGLEARARERRSFIPQECRELFDISVLGPTLLPDVGRQIASSLAWDNALKFSYPKAVAAEVDQFLSALLLAKGGEHISRFRVVKKLWDTFYRRASQAHPERIAELNRVNKAMRLKSRRDFLDCDLIHLACFGWFGDDVLVFTCDPPDTVLGRLSVYKSMIAAIPSEVPPKDLPKVRDGIVACCTPRGEITHLFPAQRVPTII
ncbi:MAG: hypothetical protein AAGD43_29385 [Pseudomonadota bacterium]